jgi:uncharacterized membrane protein
MAKAKKAKSLDARSRKWALQTALPWLLLIGGAIALVASISLSIEVFDRLKNPNYVPVCNLNPILSCTSVADSRQAEAFGFPNYFIGIAGYAVLATVGAALLAGARFKRWFWLAVEAGLAFALIFIHWLIFQTLYRIGALCIFCMIVWAMTIPMFWYFTLYNIGNGTIGFPPRLNRAAAFARRHHGDILLLWFLIIIALIAKRFWYYWSTLI